MDDCRDSIPPQHTAWYFQAARCQNAIFKAVPEVVVLVANNTQQVAQALVAVLAIFPWSRDKKTG